MASGKDTRRKVVLARILEKQGLGGTPVNEKQFVNRLSFEFKAKVSTM